MEELVIYGAGGHAVSVLDILLECENFNIVAVLERDAEHRKLYGVQVTDENCLHELYERGVRAAFAAVGDNAVRAEISARLIAEGFRQINAISRHAYVSERARLGHGVAIMPNASIIAGTVIGNGVVINTNASIDHDCEIGEFCHIAPGSTICGGVTIGNGTFVCAGAKIANYVKIGANCVIGAGAVVINDIGDGQTVVGVPAKPIKYRGEND
jgi:UDP-perosamine 4-acetyltransferase